MIISKEQIIDLHKQLIEETGGHTDFATKGCLIPHTTRRFSNSTIKNYFPQFSKNQHGLLSN